jgi:hypothetical protein
MSRAVGKRLLKLETSAGLVGEFIPVFCVDEADFEAAFARKVRWGVCEAKDRPRCRPWDDPVFEEQREARNRMWHHWLHENGPPPSGPQFGTHEEWVWLLAEANRREAAI